MRQARGWVPCVLGMLFVAACSSADEHPPPLGSGVQDSGGSLPPDQEAGASGAGGAGKGGAGNGGGGKASAGGAGGGGAGGEPADAGGGESGGAIGAGGHGPGSGGAIGSGGQGSGAGGLGPTDSGSPDLPDGFVCAPPYVCTPPGSGGTATVEPGCAGMDVVLDAHGLHATGPTTAFADAYNAALAGSSAGPFVVHLTKTMVDVNYQRALVAGAKAATGGKVSLTETPANYLYQGASTRMILVPIDTVGFHLAFDTSQNAAGNILAAGLYVQGTMNTACNALENVSGSLFIEESQASVPFGSSTLGALLGPKSDIGTGTDGWTVPLSGTASKVLVQ